MRRIQRSSDKEALVKALTDGENPCFGEIWRLLIFAAILGRKLGRREALGQVESGKAVMESYFRNAQVWPGLIYLLGLVETSSTSVLQGSDEAENTLATIFEEYANGGLSYLKERLADREIEATDLLDIINELTSAPQTGAVDLSGVSI